MKNFDNLLARHEIRLISELKIPLEKTKRIATEIAIEINEIKDDLLQELNYSYVLSIDDRLQELYALDIVLQNRELILKQKELSRILLNYQNYILFVYLKDTLFDVMKPLSKSGSIIKECAKYLTDGKIRYFRNSIAHGNYRLLNDKTGVEYWAQKGSKQKFSMIHFEVTSEELQFWIDLSKTLTITSYVTLLEQ